MAPPRENLCLDGPEYSQALRERVRARILLPGSMVTPLSRCPCSEFSRLQACPLTFSWRLGKVMLEKASEAETSYQAGHGCDQNRVRL